MICAYLDLLVLAFFLEFNVLVYLQVHQCPPHLALRLASAQT